MIESSPITTKKSIGSYAGFTSMVLRLPLPLILLLQASTSLLALRNTAFQDEALYLFAGRQIFLTWMGKTSYLEPYGLYFSGYPSFYPVIGGVLDFLGGLEAARLFSLLCMLIVTTCAYYMTLQFFDRKSALLAALLFSCEGSVLFLGRLATYDAFCLCLLALVIMLCLRAGKAASAQSCLAMGPLLVLVVAAKYAGLLFVPTVLALLAWWSWKHKGLEEMFVRLGIALFSLAVSGFIAYLNIDKQVLTGLSFTTTNRASGSGAMPILVIQHIAMMEGIFFGLGLLGLLLCARQAGPKRPAGLLLFGSALLVPLYHTYKGELVSLDKHLAFSMFFLAPLAGFAIASLVGLWQKRSVRLSCVGLWQKRSVRLSWFTALALCLLTLPLGLQQARTLYGDWPSSTQLTAFLRPRVQLGIGHYLAEDFDVLRYNLKNETDIWQWSSLDYFVYTDKEYHNLSGEAAYKGAIQEGYFDLIELSYGYHTPLAMQITQYLTASKHYDLIARIPIHNSYGAGYFWVWSKHAGESRSSDSFQRTVASGWGNADTGGWWTVVGSPWAWSVSPGAGNVTVGANAEERAYLSTFTIQDVDLVERVVLPRCSGSTNCDAFVLGRYTAAYNPTYYRVGVVQGAGRADILLRAQRSDGTALGSDLDTHLPASTGAVVWLHVQFQGVNPTAIRARAWLNGTSEPSTWLLNTTDSTSAEQKAGMVGVRLRNEDTSASHTFQVESYQATGTSFPVSVTPNPSGSTTAHWLYVVDDGQVYAYDIDNNHALVKQFPIPEAGKRGVAVAPKQGLLYVSECGTTNCSGSHGSLLAYDLVHDVVAWIANYSFGVDQLAITPDGSTIYMPHGADASDGTHTILNASDGKVIGTIQTGTNGHNTIVSLDGTQVYLTGYTGSNSNDAHVVNTATNQVMLNAGPTINGVRPFTVNGKNTLMFTTSTNTCGFQVLSLTTGTVLYTIPFSGPCNWTASNAPSHGISLSPDEKRVYVVDAPLDQLEVYDVSGLPTSAPSFVASVPLTSFSGSESPCQTYCEREGWVLNDLSGRYVYVGDTGNVVSTSTLSVVATLPALQNTRLVVEIDWTNGTPNTTSTRFGLGRVTS